MVLVRGTSDDDTLVGSELQDTLDGLDGDDLLQGLGGDDTLLGGDDDDTLEGNEGNDKLFGGDDDDFLEGGEGNDTLGGEDDDDTIFGGSGIDTLDGGSGNDFLDGGKDNDLVTGATGDDTLIGGDGDDVINGGFGIDSLVGGKGADIFKYSELQDSTLDEGIDRIEDLAIGTDAIAVPEIILRTEVTQLGAVENLDEASIAAVLTDETFAANTAATFTVDERAFLAVNDGNAGFSASNDGLIEITDFTGDLADLTLANSNQIVDVPTQSAIVPDSSLPQTEVPWNNKDLNPQQIFIEDASQIQNAIANAKPGDTLILKNGVYQDLNIHLNRSGITLRPETAGGVTITGDSDIYDELSNRSVNNKPLTPTEVGAFWTEGQFGKNLSADKRTFLVGSKNNDYLDASTGRGGKFLLGRDGNDEIILSSNNFARGGNGNDFFDAKYGSGNFILGGNGNDQIIVTSSNFVWGEDGSDFFDAKFSSGGNALLGGKGNDEFLLGTGDRVVGGEGSDLFVTYFGGDNTMTGGAGADEFWLANGQIASSPNTITDFTPGTDVLGISGLDLTFSNLNLMQEGKDTIIAVNDTQLAILQGVKASDLSKANFSFI